VREAYRLTGVPTRSIRRWTSGYHFEGRGERKWSEPVVRNDLRRAFGGILLDFADLLEVRFVGAFRRYGVSWKAIRIASEGAREILNVDHPFSSRKFSTDGRTILAEIVTADGDEMLLDLVKKQYEFQRMVNMYKRGEIEFDALGAPQRWFPVEGSTRIVVDPQRSFGAPIVAREGIPTKILAHSAIAENSIEATAAVFEVDPISVAEAVEFELTPTAV